jgi:hypothetical protein
MAKAGYRKMGNYWTGNDGAGWYLRKLVTPEAAIVGFIVHCDDPGAFEKALFVATLRANPALRTEYAALKARLSSTTTDFQMYTIGKTQFIAKMRTELEIPVFYGAYGCANIDESFLATIHRGEMPPSPTDPTMDINMATHLWGIDVYHQVREVGTALGFALAMIFVPQCSYLHSMLALEKGENPLIPPPLAASPHAALKAIIRMGGVCCSWFTTYQQTSCDGFNLGQRMTSDHQSQINLAQRKALENACFHPLETVFGTQSGRCLLFGSAVAFGAPALQLLIECGWHPSDSDVREARRFGLLTVIAAAEKKAAAAKKAADEKAAAEKAAAERAAFFHNLPSTIRSVLRQVLPGERMSLLDEGTYGRPDAEVLPLITPATARATDHVRRISHATLGTAPPGGAGAGEGPQGEAAARPHDSAHSPSLARPVCKALCPSHPLHPRRRSPTSSHRCCVPHTVRAVAPSLGRYEQLIGGGGAGAPRGVPGGRLGDEQCTPPPSPCRVDKRPLAVINS